ncbi:hypothetical protein C8R41DRAFT_772031 [Lentinula lateritia]|uniref:Alpha-ketoglutarate-dependent dioxygenase AlkB-like domain-containing protein n=1 Tax=Lentinula lateritia TaxID=40482 RepID=A0ABQ8V850_9AGAR|nr:hypothetical protein C8R41DRAFT_772031 [Lentinula lateritia]
MFYHYRIFCRHNILSKRPFSATAQYSGTIPPDFHFIPDFFSVSEQRTLLSAALLRLDAAGSRRFQRRRKILLNALVSNCEGPPAEWFLPDDCYEFLEGHYDGVIHKFREMHLTSWPTNEILGLLPVLNRLHSLIPSHNIQTHLLHLASDGEILPHVDNVSASGRWILGVSLGSERILRLESCTHPDEGAEILLPSGSVYIQSDNVRFKYKHSILKSSASLSGIGQRISIMIRVSSFVIQFS